MQTNIEKLKREIRELEDQLRERKEALPAHSIRPNQLQRIEELEEKIQEKKEALESLRDEYGRA